MSELLVPGLLFGGIVLAVVLIRRATARRHEFPPVYQAFAPQHERPKEPEIPDRAARPPGDAFGAGEDTVQVPPDPALPAPPPRALPPGSTRGQDEDGV
jgi:hypothetical protein